jgi:hypothetical protein
MRRPPRHDGRGIPARLHPPGVSARGAAPAGRRSSGAPGRPPSRACVGTRDGACFHHCSGVRHQIGAPGNSIHLRSRLRRVALGPGESIPHHEETEWRKATGASGAHRRVRPLLAPATKGGDLMVFVDSAPLRRPTLRALCAGALGRMRTPRRRSPSPTPGRSSRYYIDYGGMVGHGQGPFVDFFPPCLPS